MSLPTTIPAALLETILLRLATLLLPGANGDMEAARQAAIHTLAAYHPQTEDELRLAANIVCFGLQALEALAQASGPDLPITRVLRLRGSAVSLSREAGKAERRLDQLKTARQPAQAEPEPAPVQPESTQPEPRPEIAMIQPTITQAAKTNGQSWSKAYDDRQRELRIAASIKRAEARAAAQTNVPNPHPIAQAV